MAGQLEESTVYVAATRPALFAGVPLPLAGAFLMAAGFVIVLFKNPFYEVLMIPVWVGARFMVARDYNAANVVFLWLRTAGRGVDSSHWGGSTVSPNPIKVGPSGRGMLS